MPPAEMLSAWLAETYDLPGPVECHLLRAYTNDVYLVRSAEIGSVLKIYGRNWRTEEEIRYEVALVRHLAAHGLAVAEPIAAKNDDFVKLVAAERDVRRYAVLFTQAPGEKPRPPFTSSLYQAFGQAIARMHILSDGFHTPHGRRPLDCTLLLDEPLALVSPLLDSAADRHYLNSLISRLHDSLARLTAEGMDWGPIHADATLDNLHVTNDGGIILYDFDSGGPGWRAADLQGWTVLDDEYTERGDAFQRGYSCIRPLNPTDLAAAPILTLAWDIWGLKIDLENRIHAQGRDRTETYLREQMACLRDRDARITTRRRALFAH